MLSIDHCRHRLNNAAGFEKYTHREAERIRDVLYQIAAAALQTPMIGDDGTIHQPNHRRVHVHTPHRNPA